MPDPAAQHQPRRPGRPSGSTGADLLAVARDVFLEHGYGGATMDRVAARARISKQTLYGEYAAKNLLYEAVVRDWVDRGFDSLRPYVEALAEADDAEAALLVLADVLLAGVLSAPVLQMRALVAAESGRFPQVADDYLDRSWNRNIDLLAGALARLADRRVLRVDDASVAAEQFTWLVLGGPLNQQTLQGGAGAIDSMQRARYREEAVVTFLSRYNSA